MTASRLLSWNNECIKKALSDGKREEQPNMDGNLLARRIVCIAVRERATNSTRQKGFFFSPNLFIDFIAFAVQYVSGLCLPSRVRVQLSNNGRVCVGSG